MIAQTESLDRWPISHEHRQTAVAALMQIIEGDDTPLVIRACRVLLQLDEANADWHEIENESIRGRIQQMIQERNRASSN